MNIDKEIKDFLAKVLSTKFVTTVLIIILASVFLGAGALTAQIWADLMKTVLFIYAGANVAQIFVKNKNGNCTS